MRAGAAAGGAATMRPTALLRSPRALEHDTGGHPENPGRIRAIDAELARSGLLAGRPELSFGPAPLAAVERVHDPAYVAALREFATRGGGYLDADTIVRPESFDVALLAAGAGIAAVDAVIDGAARRAFVLMRPPGHHATPRRGMGFCLLNSVAIAAEQARARGADRVFILDWDVHHGNGTQDAFWERGDVVFCSLHQWPLYPGTGAADERGAGAGRGATINLPLPPGSGDAAYLAAFAATVLPAIAAARPDLLLISAGFDAHAADPLANMRVTAEGFAALARQAAAAADEVCGGRVVALLEGGYDPEALAASVAAVLRAFDAPANGAPGADDLTPGDDAERSETSA
ncbi:MAG TPA: histone deacetylase [Thermomicrobiales bacterium]|nr:histone deacetylase [Thermomicrobiales bacterium]